MVTKETEKYRDLTIEIKRLWNKMVVPVISGALGKKLKQLPRRLKVLGIETYRKVLSCFTKEDSLFSLETCQLTSR